MKNCSPTITENVGSSTTLDNSAEKNYCPVIVSETAEINNNNAASAKILSDPSGKMHGSLKYLSLGLLLTQQTVMPLLVRYSRVRKTDQMFLATSAVLMNEILKLLFCVSVLILKERSIWRFYLSLYHAIVREPLETLKVCVPSMIFIIQNNLYFVALSNLEPSTYLITYQLRILTTAFFFVTMLNRKLSSAQWFSLVVLMCGVSLVQLQDQSTAPPQDQVGRVSPVSHSKILGFGAVISMCLTSGFGGVYFEKVLKGSSTNIWMQNIRLALLGIPLSFITMLFKDWSSIRDDGILGGYDWLVWLLTFFNSVGGLVIATVMKYADNILKAYAQASAIVFAFLGSAVIFDFEPSMGFIVGAVLVIISVYIYAKFPPVDHARR